MLLHYEITCYECERVHMPQSIYTGLNLVEQIEHPTVVLLDAPHELKVVCDDCEDKLFHTGGVPKFKHNYSMPTTTEEYVNAPQWTLFE